MPHKMNSRSCERINGLAVVLRGHLSMVAELAGDQWNEGDVSCSVVRRVALPDAFLAADGLFQTFLTVLDELGAYPAVIAARARPLPAVPRHHQGAGGRGAARASAARWPTRRSRSTPSPSPSPCASTAAPAATTCSTAWPPTTGSASTGPTLDALLADRLSFTGAAADQVARVVERIDAVVAAHPEARVLRPGGDPVTGVSTRDRLRLRVRPLGDDAHRQPAGRRRPRARSSSPRPSSSSATCSTPGAVGRVVASPPTSAATTASPCGGHLDAPAELRLLAATDVADALSSSPPPTRARRARLARRRPDPVVHRLRRAAAPARARAPASSTSCATAAPSTPASGGLPWGPNTPSQTALFWQTRVAQGIRRLRVRAARRSASRTCWPTRAPPSASGPASIGRRAGHRRIRCRFVAAQPDARYHARLAGGVDPGRADAWRDSLPPTEVETFEYWAGDVLERFGYELVHGGYARRPVRPAAFATGCRSSSASTPSTPHGGAVISGRGRLRADRPPAGPSQRSTKTTVAQRHPA